jgi:hypothetical protein
MLGAAFQWQKLWSKGLLPGISQHSSADTVERFLLGEEILGAADCSVFRGPAVWR